MISGAAIALLRLVVYGFIIANAASKGYRWLAASAIYAALVAVVSFFIHLGPEALGLISSGFALLLMMHALDLKQKDRR